jgi:hypothetical protein
MSNQVKVGSPSLAVGVLSHRQYLDSWSSEEDLDDKGKNTTTFFTWWQIIK